MAITPLPTPEVTVLALVFGVGIGAVFALHQLGEPQDSNQQKP
jgi:hypothetical protein